MALYDAYKRAELDRAFDGKLFIKSSDFAALLGVTVRSVQRWVDEGSIEYCDRTPGGHLLFDRATAEEVIKKVIAGKLFGESICDGQLSFFDEEKTE